MIENAVSSMKYVHLIGLSLLVANCSPQQYRAQADKEVYSILKKAEKHVYGKSKNFSINNEYSSRDPQSVKSDEILQKSLSGGTLTLSIDQAISYGSRYSRDYQGQKERLYLAALSLSGTEHSYSPNFSGTAGIKGRKLSNEETQGTTNGRLGVRQALLAGGSYSLSLANDLLKFFTGDPRRSASSVISLNILQPLLRGAGKDIAAERLTQSNRNVIYALRDFNQYQNEFSRDIVIQYLRLLQQKESVQNELKNYESRKANTEYLRARAVDRASPQEVSDSEQGELQAKNRWINAKSRYQTSLDSFKLTLGMPTSTKIVLLDSELQRIEKAGLHPIRMTHQQAFRTALRHRLPLLNDIDRFEDTKRQVLISADQLKADVNLVSTSSLRNTADSYEKFNFNNLSTEIGLELNLPINRKNERNNYRRSLISFSSGIRSLSRSYDSLNNLVKQRLREIEQFRQSYKIQKGALALAEKRVEGNKLRFQAGTLIFRRLSESQDALISAQNAVTAALIDYQRARLQLYTDIGILDVDKNAYWLKSNPVRR